MQVVDDVALPGLGTARKHRVLDPKSRRSAHVASEEEVVSLSGPSRCGGPVGLVRHPTRMEVSGGCYRDSMVAAVSSTTGWIASTHSAYWEPDG